MLTEFGRLQLQVGPPNARVSYVRNGQAVSWHARGGDTVWLPQGKYSITIEAPGYVAQSKENITVNSGQGTIVEVELDAKGEPSYQKNNPPEVIPVRSESWFEYPSQVKLEDGWWRAPGPAEYVFLRAVLFIT
jgi:hypothetical protein